MTSCRPLASRSCCTFCWYLLLRSLVRMKHTHVSLCSTRTTWLPGALPLPHILENQNSQRKRAYSWVQSRCILTGSLFDIQLCEPWVCIKNILQRKYISKREESNTFLNRCDEVTAPSIEDLWEQRDRNDSKNPQELSGLTRFTHCVWHLMSNFFFTRTYLVIIVLPTSYNELFSWE